MTETTQRHSRLGVHPSRTDVAGLSCFPRIADLPEAPESALLLVNHKRVEEAFEAAAASVCARVARIG